MKKKSRPGQDEVKLRQKILETLTPLVEHQGLSFQAGYRSREDVLVNPADILYLTRYHKKVKVFTDHGECFLDGIMNYAEKLVVNFPGLCRTHEDFIVNLDRVVKIIWAPEEAGDYTLTLDSSDKVPLTTTYESRVETYFGLPTLKHVTPYSRIAQILHEEEIQEWKRDIRKWNARELRRKFSNPGGEFNAALLVRNIIWQTYKGIMSGDQLPLDGNIRSYWYSHLKSVLGKVGEVDESDHYQTEIGMFVKLVSEHKLFRYKDFGFQDERKHLKRIGKENAHVILFAEKRGFINTMEELHHELGVTTICLAGQPSHLSTEYFIEDLGKAVELSETEFQIFALCDYDPAGWSIMNEFLEQLKTRNIKCRHHNLMRLSQFTDQEIEEYKFPLTFSGSWATKLNEWMELTNGINGERFGIEIDTKPREAWKEIIRQEAGPFLAPVSRRLNRNLVEIFLANMRDIVDDVYVMTRSEARDKLLLEIERFLDITYGPTKRRKSSQGHVRIDGFGSRGI